ncbi:peptidase S9 [Marinobacterium zhoushanense]|uniref:Peptidase S9 n=1 Tax=Marinobacterium zhoushanense TaxID=1679163 RepID=A0ABQ1KBQ4_9GAMM|nr:prolyl oligopeptidase family serine peptidase [Marinobacterium zhoushanense]GGB93031.1 peptidase S9 [Marinobacterium zhoushanense]
MFSPAQVEQPISATDAVKAIQEYAALRTQGGRVYGISFDSRSGQNRLCLFRQGEAISLLPSAFSVRSRVHEYGGGGWCLSNSNAFFVNDSDQQVWCLSLEEGVVRRLTDLPDSRFADLVFDACRQRLIAICETHQSDAEKPVNRLVSIGGDGRLRVLAEGADFYASPTLSPDGSQLAWVEWNHPNQPWTYTRLYLAALTENGHSMDCREVSDCVGAWAQPRFSPEGELHVVIDRQNWWRIERFNGVSFTPLPGDEPADTEFTTAPWQFGIATYGWDDAGQLYAIGQHQGYSGLFRHAGDRWQRLHLDVPATRLHSLTLADDKICCIAEYSSRCPAVLCLYGEVGSATLFSDALYGGAVPDYPVTNPEPGATPLQPSGAVPYFLYRPDASGVTPLPLVIYTHGGPTAATAPTFKPGIQFWTQRGFMIADINYRGSTGYGRDYRMQLEGQWGVADVEDVIAVALDLIERQLADPAAIFIRGNSAGGFTTLSALTKSKLFTGGASLYGVSDPARLNEVTHKFESHYLHWLIGDPIVHAMRYDQRSPLNNAERISAPVIFFQGERDRVVLPEQTRLMAERLSAKGLSVESHFFDDEAHGFRKAENQAQVLEQELAFYLQLLRQSVRNK